MLIKVKREHINMGARRNRDRCPIVIAVREAMPDAYHVAANTGFVNVYRFRDGQHELATLRLPGVADDLQRRVDGVARKGKPPGREYLLAEINPIAFDFPDDAFTRF